MAVGVRVRVTDRAIITALNTPGGAVFRWRDEVGREVKLVAEATSPINELQNAVHRGEEVGVLKGGWDWNRYGNGHVVGARVFNTAPHALYVELGRSTSYKMQIFSWTEWQGGIKRIGGPKPKDPEFARSEREREFLVRRQERLRRTLPEYAGEKTRAREGYHILSRALVAVLGAQGIPASV
ncbi:MAG TPA: hypothetical protein VIX41_09410 [Acidimicrobiales bacterium]